MTWYAVWNRETGRLFSIGTSLADPLPDELSALEMDEQPDPVDWDEGERAFVTKIELPLARDLEVVTPQQVGSLDEVLAEDLEAEEETNDEQLPDTPLS